MNKLIHYFPLTFHHSNLRTAIERLKSYRFQMRTFKNSFMLRRFLMRTPALQRDPTTPNLAIINQFVSWWRNMKRWNWNLRYYWWRLGRKCSIWVMSKRKFDQIVQNKCRLMSIVRHSKLKSRQSIPKHKPPLQNFLLFIVFFKVEFVSLSKN